MRVLGIDPGLSVTGFGVVEKLENELHVIAYGGIEKNKSLKFSDNLLSIYQKIRDIVEEVEPDSCAVEDIFYHQNKKTAIIMGHVRGVAMIAAAGGKIPVFEYSPKEVKLSIVGHGAGSKPQVQAMVKNILGMKMIPEPEDAADALAVAICHIHRMKMKALLEKK